jgi:para-nitrobenzyl esterase
MKNKMKRFDSRPLLGWVMCIGLTASLFSVCAHSAGSESLTVTTTFGSVVGTFGKNAKDGKDDESIRAWLGIPYAKAPIGNLRWKAPIDPDSWTTPLETKKYGNVCSQLGSLVSPPPAGMDYGFANIDTIGKPIGNEDCLTLNIWSPSPSANLPVLVFIHGGSGKSGSSSMDDYNGEILAKQANAVVVTINYRLGIFGWLNHPALKSGKTGDELNDSGNFGTLDQIAAFRFVKNNIDKFGGDPKNITAMGQSFGAASVYAMMLTPLVLKDNKLVTGEPKDDPWLHKAIPMSPGLITRTTIEGEDYANQLFQQLVIADKLVDDFSKKDKNWKRAYLYSKSTIDLMGVTARIPQNPPYIFNDGFVIPTCPEAAIKAGKFRNVPLIIGHTFEEGKLFAALEKEWTVSDQIRLTYMSQFDPNLSKQTLEISDLISDDPKTYADTMKLHDFMWYTDRLIQLMRSKQNNIYVYSFNWNQQLEPWKTVYGATHASDVAFMFGTFDKPSIFSAGYSTANKGGREALSNAMISRVKNFIHSDGNPNDDPSSCPNGDTCWNQWSSDKLHTKNELTFDADNANTNIRMEYRSPESKPDKEPDPVPKECTNNK